ncbi:D-alanyl-D-alanine carboxypeptidase family protein [Marinobacter nanhaiticus D15-8W]|uniref:serine-type D-Ala-D-Ala carboxypeptidase n=1 Tax=Marinobacter nanhaiticus D15-8W TaxID=626887 RepID=N6W983_9GAMM|nr:D-alanyl-D-alanine carboxypeptidase family protein [Marinobacter nanhaiticus]ENO16814.1 D-alanyl-D-alanine carboxypeptidase [Marinobacter nanhaiticus D15-8W]BES72629.1 D-alanyl-D-alanine carboxypeptidase family protein [Marinobacter nanhaiticus D15-8W]
MANKTVFQTFLYVVTFTFALVATAAAQSQQVLIPSPPQIAASSYILMDAESGRIIVEGNSHERLPPASLTKMMTAYIVERELDEGRIALEDQVPVSVNAWQTGGSRMFVKEGTQVPVEQLLKGVIIQSGNDASVALAEFIAGSEGAFADIMNQQAQILGMQDSHFINATGLPSETHYSSAYDLALLAKAIINDYPENYPIYEQKYFTYNDIRQPNRNSLLWRDPSVDGLKTGHTEEAGYCLVASAEREGMRLIATVMGTNSENARAQEVQKLLNYGFRYFETHSLFSAGEVLNEAQVWGGKAEKVQMGVADDAVVTIPRGSKGSLESVMDIDSVIQAPVQAGQELGQVRVMLNGEEIVNRPVVALEEVPEGGFFKRIWDAIKLFFVQLFN